MVIDLRKATFVDSTIIVMFLGANGEAKERGSKFLLLMDDQTGAAIRRLFEMTRLTSVFQVVSTRAAALEAVHSGSPAA